MKKNILILQIILWLVFVAISLFLLITANSLTLKILQALIMIVGTLNLILAVLNYKKGENNGK